MNQRSVAKSATGNKTTSRSFLFFGSGLLSRNDETFGESIVIRLFTKNRTGVIKYSVSPEWNMPDMENEIPYTQPIQIDQSSVLTAQLFSENGDPIDAPIQHYYQKIEPIYRYRVLGPAPQHGWEAMPDFSTLTEIRHGLAGRMTPERLEKINRELFAKMDWLRFTLMIN